MHRDDSESVWIEMIRIHSAAVASRNVGFRRSPPIDSESRPPQVLIDSVLDSQRLLLIVLIQGTMEQEFATNVDSQDYPTACNALANGRKYV